ALRVRGAPLQAMIRQPCRSLRFRGWRRHTPYGAPNDTAGGDGLVSALLLYPDDRGEEPVHVHCPDEERQPCGEDRERCDPQRQRNRTGPVEPAIEAGNGPMRNTKEEDEVKFQPWWVATRVHAFPSELLIDQKEAGYGHSGEDPEVSPEQRDVDPAGGSEQ